MWFNQPQGNPLRQHTRAVTGKGQVSRDRRWRIGYTPAPCHLIPGLFQKMSMLRALLLLPLCLLPLTLHAEPPFHALQPAEVIGGRTWLQKHPTLDGRGLVVAILDTGVDPRAQGLEKTSTGAVKVLEARDFTGQGDVNLELATLSEHNGKKRMQAGKLELADLETLAEQPTDGRFYLGTFAETQIGPVELRDLNHDGRRDSELTVAVWRVGTGEDDLRVLMDLDGNGSALGETVVKPFHVAQQLIVPTERRTQVDVTLLSLAAEPDLAQKKLSLHYTDGSHGTHVAGIISGFQVNGKDGWNGMAPGAQILSLKIGHNGRAGGATTTESFKKALEFAARWSREKQVPVVVNASYGAQIAVEGQSAIDKLVDKLVQENPQLTVTFSAGNEGPGLSTIGTPAAAELALAVGALVPKDSVPALYGGQVQGHELFAFSSRGGELNKPELVAPGVASTSVPNWDAKEMKNGTSMASPHIAGAMLLVWSGLLEQLPNQKKQLHSGIVRRALMQSARPIAGYALVEQGAGLPDVERAVTAGAALMTRPEAVATLGYHLESHVPRADGQTMPASFWRNGVAGLDGLTKTDVRAILPLTGTATERERFSAVFDVKSDADWIEVTRPQLVLRGERPATLEVRVHPEKLRQPGLYSSRVTGHEVGAPAGQIAWQSWQTIVVPERFDSARGWTRSWKGMTIPPGQIWRTFVQTPMGAQQMRISAKRRDGNFSQVVLSVFDPGGDRTRPAKRTVSSRDGSDADWIASGEALVPGTWEITLAGSLGEKELSHVDVEVSFTAVNISKIMPLHAESASLPTSSVTISHGEDRVIRVVPEGVIDSAMRTDKVQVKGDRYSRDIVLSEEFAGAMLKFKMDPQTYDKTTDVAIVALDANGKELASGSFDGIHGEIFVKRTQAGEQKFSVQVLAAFAQKPIQPWRLEVQEIFEFSTPVPLTVHDLGVLALHPYVPQKLELKPRHALPMPPNHAQWAGRLEFLLPEGRGKWLVLPIQHLGPQATPAKSHAQSADSAHAAAEAGDE